MTEQTNFQLLYQKDVSENVEKKMNLTYLSWAWAQAEMKKFDEDATVTIHEFPDPDILLSLAGADVVVTKDIIDATKVNYRKDKAGAYVKVSVTIKGRTETEYLPVMDYKNKAMVQPDAMSVNKAHKRCFVKALALHGLGLYIYAGEDLPEQPPAKQITATQVKSFKAAIKQLVEIANVVREEQTTVDTATKSYLNRNNVQKIEELNEDQYGTELRNINESIQTFEKRFKEIEKENQSAKQGEEETVQEGILDRYGNPKE